MWAKFVSLCLCSYLSVCASITTFFFFGSFLSGVPMAALRVRTRNENGSFAAAESPESISKAPPTNLLSSQRNATTTTTTSTIMVHFHHHKFISANTQYYPTGLRLRTSHLKLAKFRRIPIFRWPFLFLIAVWPDGRFTILPNTK